MKKLKRTQNHKFPIHMYGFGQYIRLNSDMLFQISKAYNGMFGYISDPTNLGTVFVNAIANILTTSALNVHLSVTFPEGTKLEKLYIGDLEGKIGRDKRSAEVNLGFVRFGQDMDILIKFKDDGCPDKFEAKLTYESMGEEISADFGEVDID